VPAPVATARPVPYQAVRVAVLGGGDSSRQLSVLLLGEGEAAPADSTEAMLVSLDAQRGLLR
jgi:hypothetical protein